jgi:hypothetical protein
VLRARNGLNGLNGFVELRAVFVRRAGMFPPLTRSHRWHVGSGVSVSLYPLPADGARAKHEDFLKFSYGRSLSSVNGAGSRNGHSCGGNFSYSLAFSSGGAVAWKSS